ncbi:MAG: PadR family transcriptional regulator [Clostridia bacterium]|nr:PadR family transcriptional regulator [Clostridia bacterium]
MDVQLKRGLLDVCVLAAIRSEESYGYQIIKDMKPYLTLSESTLYTILKRLETSELLTVRTVEHEGRLRKYFTGIFPGTGVYRNSEIRCSPKRCASVRKRLKWSVS